MTLRISLAARNAQADAFAALLNGGFAVVYTGTQPANPGTATAETQLAELSLATPAFGAAAAGKVDLTPPAQAQADATGTAGWVRFTDAADNGVLDVAAADITLNRTNVTVGDDVLITSFSYTVPLE